MAGNAVLAARIPPLAFHFENAPCQNGRVLHRLPLFGKSLNSI